MALGDWVRGDWSRDAAHHVGERDGVRRGGLAGGRAAIRSRRSRSSASIRRPARSAARCSRACSASATACFGPKPASASWPRRPSSTSAMGRRRWRCFGPAWRPTPSSRPIWDSDPDPQPERWTKQGRQFAVIDAQGQHGGLHRPEGDRRGPATSRAVLHGAGQHPRRRRVVDGMIEAFEETHGHLSMRLMAALDAGQKAGGDTRGMQSAAILIVGQGPGRVAQQRRRAAPAGGRQPGADQGDQAPRRFVERAPGEGPAAAGEIGPQRTNAETAADQGARRGPTQAATDEAAERARLFEPQRQPGGLFEPLGEAQRAERGAHLRFF